MKFEKARRWRSREKGGVGLRREMFRGDSFIAFFLFPMHFFLVGPKFIDSRGIFLSQSFRKMSVRECHGNKVFPRSFSPFSWSLLELFLLSVNCLSLKKNAHLFQKENHLWKRNLLKKQETTPDAQERKGTETKTMPEKKAEAWRLKNCEFCQENGKQRVSGENSSILMGNIAKKTLYFKENEKKIKPKNSPQTFFLENFFVRVIYNLAFYNIFYSVF